MNKSIIVWAILASGALTLFFYMFFAYFGANWIDAAISGFIIGEVLVLAPFYSLFLANWKDKSHNVKKSLY